MALPMSRYNMASMAKKSQEPDEEESKRQAMKRRLTPKAIRDKPSEEDKIVDKRKQVTY